DLTDLPDCQLWITPSITLSGETNFKATMRTGQLCSFEYQGERRFVSLGFEVRKSLNSYGQTLLLSQDKGIDPTTGQVLWGPRMGPFELWKQQDFSSQYGL
ncbi:MAG: CpcT/CpeT family chromophore lyase, partial [Cyanobacteria bacterium J06659_2]